MPPERMVWRGRSGHGRLAFTESEVHHCVSGRHARTAALVLFGTVWFLLFLDKVRYASSKSTIIWIVWKKSRKIISMTLINGRFVIKRIVIWKICTIPNCRFLFWFGWPVSLYKTLIWRIFRHIQLLQQSSAKAHARLGKFWEKIGKSLRKFLRSLHACTAGGN